LRNEVGLRADEKGNLWGVENGMDDLNRPDFGGDIHLGNPGEELVRTLVRSRERARKRRRSIELMNFIRTCLHQESIMDIPTAGRNTTCQPLLHQGAHSTVSLPS
jgi:hypothetical protein